MGRPINAALTVSAFSATSTPGEYTFENAFFNNQIDRTGDGAYAVKVGFVLFVPSTDLNTGLQLAGVVHRYKLTAVTVVDPTTVSGTILWDEPGQEGSEIPTNGVGCLLAEATPNRALGFLPNDSMYPELPLGSTVNSLLVDEWNLLDQPSGGLTFKATVGDGVSKDFAVVHSLNSLDVSVQVFDLTSGDSVYAGVQRTLNTVFLSFTEALALNSHRVLIQAI